MLQWEDNYYESVHDPLPAKPENEIANGAAATETVTVLDL